MELMPLSGAIHSLTNLLGLLRIAASPAPERQRSRRNFKLSHRARKRAAMHGHARLSADASLISQARQHGGW
jgi:hypothetical protein